MGKGGQCREGHWMGTAGPQGMSRELIQVRALTGIPLLCFYQEWWFLAGGRGRGVAGLDCCYSGTIKRAPAEPRGCKGGQLLAVGQARSPVPVLVWGQESWDMRPQQTLSYRSRGIEGGGDACADEATPKGLSQGGLEEMLGASKQRRFAAVIMVEVIFLPHTQLPKPHKKKSCKATPLKSCPHISGPSRHPVSAGQILLSPSSLAISHSFPDLLGPPLLPEQGHPFKGMLASWRLDIFFFSIYWLSRYLWIV